MSHRIAHALCILSTMVLTATSAAAAPCAARGTPDATATNSKVCLSCHDGVLARNVPHTSFRGARVTSYRGHGAHPINVDYALVFVHKSSRFHSPASLDSRIKLAKGKITCTTCHNLGSTEKKALVMSNLKSRLCLSCHNL
ncbi:MAG: hypothetical protein DRG30_10875 [Epsilonproteobacteria bacterium]|nr:MAG: hypothetical protein DRG30_10875 [Campylobacterota bacterium]